MNVTIPKEKNEDPFYRYKRNIINVTYKKKQGGITIIDNFETICRQIYRSTEQVKGFLSKSMGLSCKIAGSTLELRGVHKPEEIDDIIEEFIKTSVICKFCENPETYYFEEGRKCKACGSVNK